MGRGRGMWRFAEYFHFSREGVARENDSLEDMKEEWRRRVRLGFWGGVRGEGGGGGRGVDIGGNEAGRRWDRGGGGRGSDGW